MEKPMSKYQIGKEIEQLSKLKNSLYDQRDVAIKTVAFMRQLSCTEDGDKMRKQLMQICKQRITRINNKITELNDKIHVLQEAEKEAFA